MGDLEKLVEQHRLPERMIPLLFDAAIGLKVRNATYRASMEESGEEPIIEQTAGRDLQRLVEAGLLQPNGERRGRYYTATSAMARYVLRP
jgi:hypothetical protein